MKLPCFLPDIPLFIIYQAPIMYQLLSKKAHITSLLKTVAENTTLPDICHL